MSEGRTRVRRTFDVEGAITRLREIAASVPGFEPADSKVWRQIVRKGSYPDEYIEAAAALVDASKEVGQAAHFDARAARAGVQTSNDIRALITEARVLIEGLKFTDAKLRAALVDGCNRVYALAPGVARIDPLLEPHIRAMRHTSRRKGGRKKKVQ